MSFLCEHSCAYLQAHYALFRLIENQCYYTVNIKKHSGGKTNDSIYFIEENSGAGEWVAFTWMVAKREV